MAQPFGGPWTERKLLVLGEYLDKYTTALEPQPFKLVYVDAFAGEGQWRPNSGYGTDAYEGYRDVVEGSARIALSVPKKPFDRLIFIERDTERCNSLNELRSAFPGRDIVIRNGDANKEVAAFCGGMRGNERAVVFLDPFATDVRWETVERLARTKKADCWILFPLGAVARIMPTAEEPSPQLQARLDVIFGGREHWGSIYHDAPQRRLFGEQSQQRDTGSDSIAGLYRKRISSVFEKVAPTSLTLRNSRNAPLFELFFAASNPRGAPIAINIANHIMERWGN